MYRLLVVDDERHIVDWLYELFTEKSGLELDIFKAFSGKEALAILDSTRIDVVISDIRMPGMSGLELIEKINDSWPDAKVIFLTGFNDFEYVYKAIKADAVNYILKTEDDEEIINAVKKAIEAIVRDIRNKAVVNNAINSEQLLSQMLQREMLLELLNSQDRISMEALERLDIAMDTGRPVIMLLGQVKGDFNDLDNRKQHKNILSLKHLTGQIFSKAIEFILVDVDRSNVLWILQPQTTDRDLSLEDYNTQLAKAVIYLGEMLESLQSACMESLGLNISLVMNERPVSWDTLGQEYHSLKQIAATKFNYSAEQPVIYITDAEIGNTGFQGRDNEIVERIKKFVNNNLGSELSLMRISQNVNYNPSYVSRIFKQLNGTNLFDYIIDARVTKARELLRNDSENIQNISKSLGFSTSQYFSTVFKKMTGMTPQEYRTSRP